jgi:hypothetical protein
MMVRIPERRFDVRLEEDVSVDWQCTRCGQQRTATVQTEGAGHARAIIRWSKAREEAARRARDNLVENARNITRAAACPAYGASDPSGLEQLASTNWLHTVLMLVVGLALCGLLTWRHPDTRWMFLIIAVAAFASHTSRARRLDRLRQAVSRVRFSAPKSQAAAGKASKHRGVLAFLLDHELQDVFARPYFGTLRVGALVLRGDEADWLGPGDVSCTADEALEHARHNLASRSTASLVQAAPGVWQGRRKDELAASRLLLPELFSGLGQPGELIAFTPSEGKLFLAGSEDTDALVTAATLALEDAREVIEDSPIAGRFTAVPWVLRGGRFVPWTVPAGHALTAKLAELEALMNGRGWRP